MTKLRFAAAAALLQLHCTPDCPQGMVQEHDQCVRKGTVDNDAATPAPPDAATGGHTSAESGGASSGGASGGQGSGGREAISDAGVADAPDGDGAARCDPGFVWSTDTCLPLRIYVNSTTGDDANDGGPASPLKTFGAAMQKVRPKQHVTFHEGSWGPPTTGDHFAQPIPDDVVLEKSGAGSVAFYGGGTASLSFERSAELKDVSIVGFQQPLVALSGEPLVTGVTIRGSLSSALVGGSARLRCVSCVFEEDESKAMSIVLVQDSGRLELVNAAFYRFAFARAGIEVKDSGSVSIEGSNFGGGLQNAIRAATAGKVTLVKTHFDTPYYDVAVGGRVGAPLSELVIDDCTFASGVQLAAPIGSIRVRHSTFSLLAIGGSDLRADLGTANDHGFNTFERARPFSAPYLWVTGWGNVIDAAGNFWPPNEQGADALGRYLLPTTIRQGETGVNVEVRDDGTDGGGRAASRVEL